MNPEDNAISLLLFKIYDLMTELYTKLPLTANGNIKGYIRHDTGKELVTLEMLFKELRTSAKEYHLLIKDCIEMFRELPLTVEQIYNGYFKSTTGHKFRLIYNKVATELSRPTRIYVP